MEMKKQRKKEIKQYKFSNTSSKALDTIIITASISSALSLSVSGVELDGVSVTADVEWGLTVGNKVLHEKVSSI